MYKFGQSLAFILGLCGFGLVLYGRTDQAISTMMLAYLCSILYEVKELRKKE